MTCVRKAWLTLGQSSLLLEDRSAGYVCSSLDLGSPDIRAVVNNHPDRDGIIDRTQFFGQRLITAEVIAMASLGAQIDAVASSFGRYMVPSARPVLHYILDRPGAAERTLTLRASNYDWKIEGDAVRDIQMQWVAADPIARDPTTQSATAWSGSGGVLGRRYDLRFDRVYPVGAGLPTTATILGQGDVPIQPYLRIFGPITNPRVTFTTTGPPAVGFAIALTTRIDAGHFIGIDTKNHTAWLDDDTTKSMLSTMDWVNNKWPVLPVAPDRTLMALAGTVTTSSTQVVASWQNGYLT